MFTGLIEVVGRVAHVAPSVTGRVLRVETALGAELREGDSIAVNGVCLTALDIATTGFSADVSRATLAATTFGAIGAGARVNLERSLRADARIGGHFVSGHVDGTGRIIEWRTDGEGRWLEVDVPAHIAGYLIEKGSIAIDGISLTVASLNGRRVGVQIVPFTLQHTALSDARIGAIVNLEADLLGKYVFKLLAERGLISAAAGTGEHR